MGVSIGHIIKVDCDTGSCSCRGSWSSYKLGQVIQINILNNILGTFLQGKQTDLKQVIKKVFVKINVIAANTLVIFYSA